MFRRTVLTGRKAFDPGSEHSVFVDKPSKSVIKVTHGDDIGDGAVGQSMSVLDYLNNLALGNELFNLGTRLSQAGENPLASNVPRRASLRQGFERVQSAG